MLLETHEGELLGLYERLWGICEGESKSFKKRETEGDIQGTQQSYPGLHKSIARTSVLTHLPFLPHRVVSLVGYGGHVIYKTARISVIKVVLYLSPCSCSVAGIIKVTLLKRMCTI